MFAEGDMGQGFWDSVRLLSWAQPLYKKYFFFQNLYWPLARLFL